MENAGVGALQHVTQQKVVHAQMVYANVAIRTPALQAICTMNP